MDNISRFVADYGNEILTRNLNGSIVSKNKAGHKQSIRNFFDFYIDGQSLGNRIASTYWNDSPLNLFDEKADAIWGNGNFMDTIYLRLLLKEKLTDDEILNELKNDQNLGTTAKYGRM